jgi:hypothetical protein
MGSALCFDMEQMVFLTVIFCAIEESLGHRLTRKDVKALSGQVRVYGDDIIVPVRAAQSVVRNLEAYGLKVNRSKSFWTGMFRESCGKDYFAGVDVTFVKCRRDIPSLQKARSEQVSEIVSFVELRNNLHSKGYTVTAQEMDSLIRKLLDGVYPNVGQDSPALGCVVENNFSVDTYSTDLQKPLVKAWVVTGNAPRSKGSYAGNLMKVLSRRTGKPIPDPRHLDRAGRPAVLRMKLRTVSPF